MEGPPTLSQKARKDEHPGEPYGPNEDEVDVAVHLRRMTATLRKNLRGRAAATIDLDLVRW